jgi:nucleoside-diphosphate-sugar epimerase
MIAKAFVKMSPYPVWGTGEQIRNWTHVKDIVRGMVLAGEKIDDGTAVNLGTMERIKVSDCAREILRYTGHDAQIKFQPDKPVGPLNRVADNALAKRLLGWEPEIKFMDGLHATIDWYYKNKDRGKVEKILETMLTER